MPPGATNITVRNGDIGGFYYGIYLGDSATGTSTGHIVEGNRVNDITYMGIYVAPGGGSLVRNNLLTNIGGATVADWTLYTFGVACGDGSVEVSENWISKVTSNLNNTAAAIMVTPTATGSAAFVENNRIGAITAGSSDQSIGIWNQGTKVAYCRNNTVDATSSVDVGYLNCTSAGGHIP